MYFLFYLLILSVSYPSFSLSPENQYRSLLDFQKKNEKYQNKQKKILKIRLKRIKKNSEKSIPEEKKKEYLAQQEKNEKYQNKRINGFSNYKKQKRNYQRQQKKILKLRLIKLTRIRKKKKILKQKFKKEELLKKILK